MCFSSKCLNNTCSYNMESNAERCDIIYTCPIILSIAS